MKSKRVFVPHIRLIMIPLKLFLDIVTSSPADVTTRVTWMFSWRIKCTAAWAGHASKIIVTQLVVF